MWKHQGELPRLVGRGVGNKNRSYLLQSCQKEEEAKMTEAPSIQYEMPKAYEPRKVEGKWYQFWVEKGCFKVEIDPGKRPFVIIMPPPNVIGELHIGHALTATLEDIMTEVKGDFLKVGFAAESQDIVANAKQKLQKKQLDLIMANDITDKDSGFGADTNKVTLIDRDGKVDSLPLLTKREVADRILDKVAELLNG